MERVYISGPMTGTDDYALRFGKAESMLKNDYKVFNPARWGWFLKYIPYRFALVFDMMMMCFCDRIYMLDGWTRSGGASAEIRFAMSIGMVIMYEK